MHTSWLQWERYLTHRTHGVGQRGGGRNWPANCRNGLCSFVSLGHLQSAHSTFGADGVPRCWPTRHSLNLQHRYTDFGHGAVAGEEYTPCWPIIATHFGVNTQYGMRCLHRVSPGLRCPFLCRPLETTHAADCHSWIGAAGSPGAEAAGTDLTLMFRVAE